jgi:nucleoside-diphosphate-sugar epimerase
LAAILSAVGEQKPMLAWDLNMNGLIHMLDLAIEFKTAKVFWPSSIAVFGPHSPRVNTPQYCVMDPKQRIWLQQTGRRTLVRILF